MDYRRLQAGVKVGIYFSIVAALVTVFAVVLGGGGRSGSVVDAQAFLAGIPSNIEAEAGDVVYIVTEGFTRYGPAAEEIAALPPPGPRPEHYTEHMWIEYASSTEVIRMRSIFQDDAGAVIRETQTSPTRVSEGRTVPINAPAERAEVLAGALAAGDARVLSQTEESITIEITFPYADPFPDGRGDEAIEVPYVSDLEPESAVTEISMRSDGYVLYTRYFAITADGERVLIMSTETTLIESIDEFPED